MTIEYHLVAFEYSVIEASKAQDARIEKAQNDLRAEAVALIQAHKDSAKSNATMSFGAPGGGAVSAKPVPPERGSFPLDHDGECKPIMADYLRCLRRVRGINDEECRLLAKGYLKCRMERNLMAPDSMKNLGFTDDDKSSPKHDQAGGMKKL
ncbi:MAG: Cytochrome c oxidase assembly protein cox19 [Cirrosporium novae-zelandiae]|nr:MAG: Cytochrome c oxidase assembly protein cox19 [Cirrosporium novae-zelandiae]